MTPEERGERAQMLGRLATRARGGDRVALERLVDELRDDVFRLALRMTGHPQDAEDASQEVLVKVVTKLAGWREEARITTWVHRITVNHLLDRPRSSIERMQMSFEDFEEDLLRGIEPGGGDANPEQAVLAHEVRLGCTMAMLVCLDRDHRIAYILGELFELPGEEAAWICGVGHSAFRKRLSRARTRVQQATGRYCGLVDADAPCRCTRRVAPAIACGRIDPDGPGLRGAPVSSAGELARMADSVDLLRDAAAVLRAHPDYAAPDRLSSALRRLVARSGLMDPA
ncbi:MAG: RNA polymerase sigma factor [Thermoleophilia bacterium]